MKSGIRAVALLFAPLAILSASCAQTGAPASAPSPFFVQTSGEWSGSAALSGVSGFQGSNSDCVSADISQRVRSGTLQPEQIRVSITQEDAQVSAKVTSSTTGLSCAYSGQGTLTSWSMNPVSAGGGGTDQPSTCSAVPLTFRCDNGTVQTLTLVGSAINGTVTGGTLTGTWTNIYNVSEKGNLTLTYDYSARRQ